jgi:hypothetical protein
MEALPLAPRNGIPINEQVFKRCQAMAKRTRQACQQPAMANGKCRLHGGKSTGIKTEMGKQRHQKAVLKHGVYIKETKQTFRALRELLKESKDNLKELKG